MIYGIVTECNTFDKAFNTSQDRYDFMADNTDLASLKCPSCGAEGLMEDTGRSYERWFTQSNREDDYERISVIVLKCPVCNHFHVLMFSWIKPFCQYSYDFVMNVISDYYAVFNRNKTRTAEHFGINRRTVGRWIARLEGSRSEVRPVQKDIDDMNEFDMTALLERLRESRALFVMFIKRFITIHHHPWMVSHIDFDISIWIKTFDLNLNKVHSESS